MLGSEEGSRKSTGNGNSSASYPTTFHESGTLRMGDNPTQSVVNADGQFHYVTNLYASDAAVLPTCGSANPVMNGIALRRRLAKRLLPEGDGIGNPQSGRPIRHFFQPAMPAQPPNPGAVIDLFDGQTLVNWCMAGRGTFHVTDGALQSVPSFDLGLLWCTIPMPQNYRLELEFFIRTFQNNSGVFIRFKNPESTGDYNPAWSAVFSGFEVQIDNTGAPDGLPKHRTGAVYAVNYPGDPAPDPDFLSQFSSQEKVEPLNGRRRAELECRTTLSTRFSSQVARPLCVPGSRHSGQ